MEIRKAQVTFGDVGADNRQVFALCAPSDAEGGGITILSARAVSSTTIANSLGVGGTTYTLALHRYSGAATPAVNGTIAAPIGGTAVGWTAGKPIAFTVDNAYAFLDAGEWLVVQYNEVNSGNPVWAQVDITYALGR